MGSSDSPSRPARVAARASLASLEQASERSAEIRTVDRDASARVDEPSDAERNALDEGAARIRRPALTARDRQLAWLQRKLATARSGAAASVVIEGGSGAGRSRLLDAAIQAATQHGMTPIRADADDSIGGDYGVLRALARRLLCARPERARACAASGSSILRDYIPEFSSLAVPGAPPEPANTTEPLPAAESATRPQLVAAVRAWLRALAREQPLLIAIDDFHRIDEASAALLALLADDAHTGLCLVSSVESGALSVSPRSLEILVAASSQLRLENLNAEESAQLLRSLFGELPDSGAIERRLFELSSGNPRDLLRAAQHLVDRRVLRYADGVWRLAPQLDPADLPASLTQVLRARLETLGTSARELACALALCPDRGFRFEECAALSDRGEPQALRADLDLLLRAETLRSVGAEFRLSQPQWAALLRSYLTPERGRVLQARLARVLERRDDAFRAGQHWLRAGERTRALDVLVAHAQQLEIQTPELASSYVRSLPPDWFETFDHAIRLCEELRRPKRDGFVLRVRLAGLAPLVAVRDTRHVDTLLVELERYSGLSDWHALGPGLDPMTRVRCAQLRAEQRFAATPEPARVIAPQAALGRLARATGAALHRVVVGIDIRYLRSWPALQPFAAIPPPLSVMSKLVEGVENRYTGHVERARAIYLELLERVEQPGGAGLDPGYAELTSLVLVNGLGVIDACMGFGSSLNWVQRTAAHPAYRVYALQTTLLYHLFQGDVHSADRCNRQVERLRLETLQHSEGSHLLWEISAHALAEDLPRLRHANEQAAVLARTYRAWIAVHHFAAAEYDRVRRDCSQALHKIELALQLSTPDVHPLWSNMASAHVRTLHDLGRYDEALSMAEAYATAARHWELGLSAVPLWLALSLCQARAGQDVAAQTADDVIERLQAQRVDGLHLGLAYEMRARVALLQEDELGFARYAELCREIYSRYKNPALLAKYKRLRDEAQPSPAQSEPAGATLGSYASDTRPRITASLED